MIIGVRLRYFCHNCRSCIHKVPTTYSTWAQKIQNQEKVTNNNFRNIPKAHAYLRTTTKIPAKYQKDPSTTVGVASTRYWLSEGWIRYLRIMELRKGIYYVPLLAHLSSAQDELLWSLFVRCPSACACVRASVRPSINIFKRLLLWNRWANFAQISYGASLGWGNKKLLKWSWSIDQDGRHAHIW